jgi:hypothetical protein
VVRFPAGAREHFLLHRVQTGSGTHPVGTVGSLPGDEWPGSEAEHSSPSGVDVKNISSPLRLHGIALT